MRLSIIIPTWNEEALIGAAIDRARRLEPDETIVADGGSRDRTVEIARRRGAVAVVGPAGRGSQLNHGVQHSRGDVLLFLHADTWLGPSAAGQMARALADPAVLVGAFRQHIDAPGRRYRMLEAGNAARVRWWGLPYGDQGIFVRRQPFLEVGGFDEVPIMEDLLLMRRLRKRSPPCLLPGPLHVSARRWQQHGLLRQTFRNWALLTAERCGVSPHRLARWYRPHH